MRTSIAKWLERKLVLLRMTIARFKYEDTEEYSTTTTEIYNSERCLVMQCSATHN